MAKRLTSGMAGDKLRDDLVRHVANASPGTMLAPERSLAKQYGISVGTVRRTLKSLEDEQLVFRIQGRGTFVGPPAGRRQFGSGGTGTLLVLEKWGSSPDSFFGRRLHGISEAAEQADLSVQVQPFTPIEQLCEQLRDPQIVALLTPALASEECAAVRAVRPDMPIVVFLETTAVPGVLHIELDMACAAAQAIAWGQSQGCHRFLLIGEGDWLPTCAASCQFRLGNDHLDTIPVPVIHTVDNALRDQILNSSTDCIIVLDDWWTSAILNAVLPVRPDYLSQTRMVSLANRDVTVLPPEVARLEVDGRDFGMLAVQTINMIRTNSLFADLALYVRPRLIEPAGSSQHVGSQDKQN